MSLWKPQTVGAAEFLIEFCATSARGLLTISETHKEVLRNALCEGMLSVEENILAIREYENTRQVDAS